MAQYNFRAGAIKVYLPEDTNNTIASCDALVFAAASAEQTDFLNNDGRALLGVADSYKIILTLAGRDTTNGGITHTRSSAASSAVVVGPSATNYPKGILLSVAAGAWPTNFAEAYGVGIWIQKNSGNYKLAEYGMIDQDNVWRHMVLFDAQIDALARSESFLTSAITTANQDTEVGDRTPKGMVHRLVGITEDGVNIEDTAEQIQYRPDTSTNYARAISRGMTITFSVENNDMRDIISARAGEYSKFTSGVTFEQGKMSLQGASAIATGVRPVKLTYPVDTFKTVEEVWMLAAIRQNQTGGTTNFGKQNPPLINYTIETVNDDACLQALHTTMRRKRRSS